MPPATQPTEAVLVVDPELRDRFRLAADLRAGGATVTVTTSLCVALAYARASTPAAVVIDLTNQSLGEPSLRESLQRLAAYPVPVIGVVPLATMAARAAALGAGCTEVVDASCSGRELAARVEALRRLHGGAHAARATRERVRVGLLEVDPSSRLARREGRPVHLRPKLYDLLHALLARRGQIATRAELLAEVWGYGPDMTTRTLDHHVMQLRRVIERDVRHPEILVTVSRIGYRLENGEVDHGYGEDG